MVTDNNLRQIALAMCSYEENKGTLPPAFITSPEGKPLLSWRVLLLPYLEQENLYRQFKLDQAWDGPDNLPLLARMPTSYAAPKGYSPPDPNATYYQVFVGKGTPFEGSQGVSSKDFPDGRSNTILVVEAAAAVPWTKPEDLSCSPDQPLPKLGAISGRLFEVALADGSIRSISRETSEATIRAAITRNGGETMGPDW